MTSHDFCAAHRLLRGRGRAVAYALSVQIHDRAVVLIDAIHLFAPGFIGAVT